MKFRLTLLFCIIIAVIAGAFLGDLFANCGISYLSWLGYGKSFGFDTFALDLHILQLDLGLHMNINVMQLLLVVLAIAVAPKIANAIKTN